MSLISITIPNWKKFNPRSDRANYSWFRFENDFFHDQKIFGLTDSQIILFQLLICEASKKNKNQIEINLEYFATFRKTTSAKIASDLRELTSRGVIQPAICRQNAGEDPSFIPATIRDVRDVRDVRTNDSTSPKGDPSVQKEIVEKTNSQLVGEEWNSKVTACPKFRGWPKSRDDAAKRFLQLHSLDVWIEILTKINGSDFLSGKSSKWCATIDWALNPKNAAKILEGNYENREGAKGEKSSATEDEAKKILEGIKKFSSYESDQLQRFLGDPLFKKACSVPGGISAIRSAPSGPYQLKNLMGALNDLL